MKSLYILFFLIIIDFQPAFSQNGENEINPEIVVEVAEAEQAEIDSVTQSISEAVKELEDTIQNIQGIIEKNQEDTLSIVASIHINNWKLIPAVRKKNKQGSKKNDASKDSVLSSTLVNIDRITLVIKDGYLIEAQVFTKDTTGRSMKFNNIGPIGLTTSIMDRGQYLVHRDSIDTYYQIHTHDFWEYEGFGSYSPNDGKYQIIEKDYNSNYSNGIQLTRSAGINSTFDLKLFTDGLATFGDQPNGLVQTTASLKHIIHRKNYRDTGYFGFFHYTKLNLNVKKLDSKFATLNHDDFERFEYLQQSWLNSDLSFSLFDIWVEKKSMSTFFVDFGAKVFLTNIEKKDDINTIVSHAFFVQPGLDLRIAENFGTELSLQPFLHFVPKNTFENQSESSWFLNTDFKMHWNPLDDNENKLFGMISHTIDLETNQSFFQLQLGYSIRVSNLIKK